MPLPSTYDGQSLRKELNLSEGEGQLWDNAQSTTDHSILLLSKNIKKLSDSSDKYAKAMKLLTAGILIVAILQILITFLK
jgi:hypothetical protein